MHLIEIGHRAIAFGEIADGADLAEIAFHRIDGFEADDLRRVGRSRAQQLFQMRHVVVAIDPLLGARMAHAFDHRGVVQLVGEEHAARQQPRQRRQRRVVGDVARREQQRRFLAVQVGKLALRARHGNGWCRRCSACRPSLRRRSRSPPAWRRHFGVLAHAQIVVAAPDRDRLHRVLGVVRGGRKGAAVAHDIGEDPIAAFALQL